MTIEEQVPLAPLTTFHMGGAARFFARVSSVEELKQSLGFARDKNLRMQILGGGSNVLFADGGFDGLVMKIELRGIEFNNEEVVAAAGESWDALVAQTVAKNLWGLENLSGIPGTVGGAVAGSVGAYGQAVAQTVAWVEVFDASSGEVERLSNAQCRFGYRESLFSGAELIVLRAAFTLSAAPKPELSYNDLAERFPGITPGLADIRAAVLEIRRGKFPDLSREGTAGSFFKNPVLPADEALTLAARYPGLPLFDMPEAPGRVKVPLGWLMDKILKLHGTRVGGARLFERQILVIVAEESCTAHDVRTLARLVQEKIKKEIGIDISPEVNILQ